MKKDIPVYNIGALSAVRREDILIRRFAPYLETHQHLRLPHKHDFYHLLLFTKGSGTHSIDFQTFPVKPYQLYFMIPGQVHSWNFEGETDGYVINFSVPFFQSFLLNPDYIEQFPFFSGVLENSVVNLPGNLQTEIHQLFEQIITEAETDHRFSMDMVKVLMLQLFITVGRLGFEHTPAAKQTSYNYALLRKFLHLVEEKAGLLKLPKEYAALLFVTPNHLNTLTNEMLGKPTGEVIRDRLILEAKRLMVNLDLSIAEIAYKLNFKDNAYFSRFFKKYTNATPEEFRNQMLKKASGE
jgi:AraC family transcriptional activator of pobA